MTQPPYLLALDLGTSSVRASLYDALGEPVPGVARPGGTSSQEA